MPVMKLFSMVPLVAYERIIYDMKNREQKRMRRGGRAWVRARRAAGVDTAIERIIPQREVSERFFPFVE